MVERSQPTPTCPEACRATCCKYVVKKIPPPRTRLDWDELYWLLCHERIAVYVEQRKWYLMVDVPCRNLTRASRCRIYPHRPDVCRLHSEENCEYTGEVEFDAFLESPGDLIRLMRKRKIHDRLPGLTAGNGTRRRR